MIRPTFELIFTILQRYPSVAAGSCTFAIAFALVAGNAFYSQSGRHPDPLWATRDATTTQSVGGVPRVRPVKTRIVKAKRIPVPASREGALTVKPAPLIAEVQEALIASGDYDGAVDGLYGPMTRAAILRFQKKIGLPETGEASADLLNRIRLKAPKASAARPADPLSGLIEKEIAGIPAAPDIDTATVEKVQRGLTNSGMSDLTVDGIFGAETRSAIAEYQRRNKLEVTGKPDRALLDHLVKIGALSKG